MRTVNSNNIYEYNYKNKIVSGLTFIGSFLFVMIMILLYFLYFKKLKLLNGTFIESLINYVKIQITTYTLTGVFIMSITGGLFFVPLPMEILFASALIKNTNTLSVIIIYLFGLTIGYSIDLLIGTKFSNFSRKLISTKKFYQIKSSINKYGKSSIFLTNLLPLPSQQVSFILGVFKYNKTKFYVQFWLGQGLKTLVITGFVLLLK